LKTLQDRFDLLIDNRSKNDIFSIIATFERIGAKAYLVGGCVRDLTIGIPPRDFDIEVYGISTEVFDATMHALGAVGVGKSFFVYKYGNIDVSLPRGEKKVSDGHRGFEVYLEQDMEKACSRRDFTMNAMLLSLREFEIIDFFGGRSDIDNKIIRIVSPNHFKDDSLRVLRAMRFSAQLGFKIDAQSIAICQNIDLSDLGSERIYMEFEKLFTSTYLSHGLFFAVTLGIMKRIFALEFDRQRFFHAARVMTKIQKDRKTNQELLFLFAVAQVFRISLVKLCSRLAMPNRAIKDASLQKRIPKTITERYLVGLAIKLKISDWLGANGEPIRARAVKLGIWDMLFVPSCTSADALGLGLRGEAIGKYLRLQRAMEIRDRFSKEKI